MANETGDSSETRERNTEHVLDTRNSLPSVAAALKLFKVALSRQPRAGDTNSALDTLADTQAEVGLDVANDLESLRSAVGDLDTNNKQSLDKVGNEVNDLNPKLELIATNVLAHGHHHHSDGFRHIGATHGGHHGYHGDGHYYDSHGNVVDHHSYTPSVKIIANRTTNLIPI